MEFLGDSALRLALAQVLYEDRPTATEGDLTTAKTKRESNAHLANCARAFGLYEFVRLGAGAQTMVGSESFFLFFLLRSEGFLFIVLIVGVDNARKREGEGT